MHSSVVPVGDLFLGIPGQESLRELDQSDVRCGGFTHQLADDVARSRERRQFRRAE